MLKTLLLLKTRLSKYEVLEDSKISHQLILSYTISIIMLEKYIRRRQNKSQLNFGKTRVNVIDTDLERKLFLHFQENDLCSQATQGRKSFRLP